MAKHWWPAKLQPLFHPARYKVAYGGRGSGKSWGYARALLVKGSQNPIRVLCTRETQSSIADSVHQLLADQIAELGLEAHYTIKEQEIVGRNGTLFKFAGLRQQDVTKIKSYEGFDFVWCEEAQVISEKSWRILIPTIRKPGSEIWITFNPELDTDPTYERFIIHTPPDCVLMNLNYTDNPWFPPELEAERLHCLKTDPENYANIWEGKCRVAVEGAIYHNEIIAALEKKRVRPVPYDPMLKVHTVWDIGWNDQTSIILVQRQGSELRIIGYLEESHRTFDSWVAELKDLNYNWGTDWMPHDAKAKSQQTGMAPAEIVSRLGRRVDIVPNIGVEQGIKAARLVFRRCYFDETAAARLIQCLRRYRRRVNQVTQEPGRPEHDEFSHGADAFRYLAVISDKLSNDSWFEKSVKPDLRGYV